jgi:hypothetical protein
MGPCCVTGEGTHRDHEIWIVHSWPKFGSRPAFFAINCLGLGWDSGGGTRVAGLGWRDSGGGTRVAGLGWRDSGGGTRVAGLGGLQDRPDGHAQGGGASEQSRRHSMYVRTDCKQGV